jgi:hypothetical protein
MNLRFRTTLPRTWPLLFSVLALWGLVHALPTLYEDFEFSHNGVRTAGWYVDLDEQNEYIHYAYRAGSVVYGGHESWREENSDIYSHHNGDKVEIKYLPTKPWVSTRRLDPRWYLFSPESFASFYIAVFFGGIWVCTLEKLKSS